MKSKMTPDLIEVRAILIGWVKYEGIYCVAAETLNKVTFTGLNNGAGRARMLGVRKVTREFTAPSDCKFNIEGLFKTFTEKTKRSFFTRHQLVYLYTQPDALAYLIRPLVTNPVVVSILPEKNKITVTAYTAKTVFSALHLKRFVKHVGKKLPDNVTLVEKKEKSKNEEK